MMSDAGPCAGFFRGVLELRPKGPYSLRDSVGTSAGGTRRRVGAAWWFALRPDGGHAVAAVTPRADGTLAVTLSGDAPEVALADLRRLLAIDIDPAPFLAAARRDPLLARLVARRPGLRPAGRATVGHALLAGMAGQLIADAEARLIDRRVVRMVNPGPGPLLAPPTGAELAALAPATLVGAGLAARRAAALIRLARSIDLEGLRDRDPAEVAVRIERERDMGPWTAAIVIRDGLGGFGHGPVGDLGLMRLCTALHGRRATVADTRDLLAPYGAWAGLAAAHLLRHPLAARRGPVPAGRRAHD